MPGQYILRKTRTGYKAYWDDRVRYHADANDFEKYIILDEDLRSRYRCSFCDRGYWRKENVLICIQRCLGEKRMNEREEKKARNFKILKETQKFYSARYHTSIEYVRFSLALWRLYRYLDVSPKEIAEKLGRNTQLVQKMIGRIFRRICVDSPSCPFREILMGKK